MDKILARVSWMGSGSFDIGMGQDDSEDIPLPEEDEALIDTQYIHWGYVNSSKRAGKGRSIKIDKWNTYWLELCGSTVRFYRDSSLHVESALFPPPSTFMLAENETKVAFFELENAQVHILLDEEFSRLSRKMTRKLVDPQVFRRHLFELKLHNIHSTYIFQAPSRCAMLRWVSKIQESIDAIEHDEMPYLAEERLKLARDMMGVSSKKVHEFVVQETDGDVDSISVLSDITDTNNINPTLINLKKQLALKKEQIWQFEAQLIDFYGRGKGDFKRNEFMCTTNQDYFLVPGRIETFIPAGTKVTIFGQLPNKRWRCVVEMNELVKVMGVLVDDLKDESEPELDNKGENVVISTGRNKEVLDNLLNNLPDYPLLGCLPTSILNIKSNKTDNKEVIPKPRTKTRQSMYNVTIVPTPYNAPEIPNPSEISIIPEVNSDTVVLETLDDSDTSSDIGVCIGDIDIKLNEALNTNDNVQDNVEGHMCDAIVIEDLKITDLDALTTQRSESESASEGEGEEDEVHHIIDDVKLRNFGDGFIIRNKLRQKGISIMVGSSSSEDDDDNVQDGRGKCNGITNAVFQKYVSTGASKKSEELENSWKSEEKGDISPIKCQEDLTKSYSYDTIENKCEFTTNPDLLHRFGQQSIHLEQDKALAKALVQVFHESKKGPDVKPPRNDRRTLKLSKSDDQGYGFWLQTYDLGKTDSVNKTTFVRYVEDEGPAYLAGLRAGDVIVEVNGHDVEDIEHMKIVGLISETVKQLMLVVKFLDMVRHVELEIQLKNRQAKLKVKEEELERIKEEERKLLNTNECEYSKDEQSLLSILPTSTNSSTYSISLEGDLDLVSLDTSGDSLGSPSSISDEVVVTTSKFEKCSPRVLDSIKEINCVCTTPGVPGNISKLDSNVSLSTTDKDLLNMHSDNIGTSWNRNLMPLQRNEGIPTQKQNLLKTLSLESFEPQNIEETMGEFEPDEPDTICGDMLCDERIRVENNSDEFVEQHECCNRTKSYKTAVESIIIEPSPSDS